MSTYIQATKEIAIKQFSTITSCVKQHPFLTAIPLLILTLGAIYRFSHQTTNASSNSNNSDKPAASGSRNPAPLTRPRQGETINAQNNSNNEPLLEASEEKPAGELEEAPSESGSGEEQPARDPIRLPRQDEPIDAQNNSNTKPLFGTSETKQAEESEDGGHAFIFEAPGEKQTEKPEQAPLAGQDETVDAQDESQILALSLALKDERSNPAFVIKEQVSQLNASSTGKLYNMCQDAQRQKLIGIYLSPEQLAHLATQLHIVFDFQYKFGQALITSELKEERLTSFFQEFSKVELLTIKEKRDFFQKVFPSYSITTVALYKNLERILILSALIQHKEGDVAKLYPSRAMSELKELAPESIKIDLTPKQHEALAKVNLTAQITDRYQKFKDAPEAAKPRAARGVLELLTTSDRIKATFTKYEDLRPYFVQFLSDKNRTELLNNPECLRQARKAISANGFTALRKKDERLLQN